MVKRVELPDGQIAEFPDDATEEEILSIAQQLSGEQEQESGPSLDLGRGVRESALSIGTAGVAQPIAGLVGIGSTIYDAAFGNDEVLENAANRVRAVEDALTFQPRSDEGKLILDSIDRTVVEPFASQVRAVSDATFEQFGPEAATAVRTFLEGGESVLTRRPSKMPDIADAESRLEGMRINPDSSPMDRREQIADAASRQSVQTRGEGMQEIQSAVQAAREEAKAQVDSLFEEARGFDAGIDVDAARPLPQFINKSLETFDVDDMPTVRKRLDEINQIIESTPENSSVRLNELQKWRQRINANRPPNSEGRATPEGAANDIMKAQYDKWRDSQFVADMVSGSESAIKKWREAIKSSSDFKKKFTDEKAIRLMSQQQLTPEEARRLVFGMGQTGFQPQAASIVRRLEDIIGRDSPEFAALQNEAALNVMDPLLQMEPNFRQFVKNYDRVFKNNETLMGELFSEDQLKNMKALRDSALSTQRKAPDPNRFNFDRAVAVFAGGNKLAKGTQRVSILSRLVGTLRKAGSKSNRRQLLGDMLGYDPGTPTLSKVGPAIGALSAGQITESGEESATFDEDPPGSETRDQ